MSRLTDYEKAFCAYLATMMSERRRELLPRVLRNRTRHLTVALEDVYFPHNASACLRSCDCFGIQDVHVIENRNPFAPNKDITRGASQWLSVNRYARTRDWTSQSTDNTVRCIETLRADGYAIVVTSPHKPHCDLETYDISRKTALFFGNEHQGLTQTALDMADCRMNVPMFGFTESFNLSVAVAICLHHLVWRIRQHDIDWQLTPEERERLLFDWMCIATGRKKRRAYELRFKSLFDPLDPMRDLPAWPDWNAVMSGDGSNIASFSDEIEPESMNRTSH